MTGRGVDQILPHPSGHQIFEPYVQDAREYVELAESRNGPISTPVTGAYIWGDALAEFERVRPDTRIVNLETSVTVSNDHWRGKGINYRMHPENVECLTAARIDVCGLANNHVLDLYGCGDFINDYEGIEGHEQYRDDLVLMYFATLSPATGELTALAMTPMEIRNVKLNKTSAADSQWLRETLQRVSAPYGTHVDLMPDGTLALRWGRQIPRESAAIGAVTPAERKP